MRDCPVGTVAVFSSQLEAPSEPCPDRIDSLLDPARHSAGERGKSPLTSTWAASVAGGSAFSENFIRAGGRRR